MGDSARVLAQFRAIVGARHVLRGTSTKTFVTGYREGSGAALAVVRPGSLVEFWRVTRVAVDAELVIIVQAANTGLTGGSTPNGEYDRPVVVISTLRLCGIYPLRSGTQAICLAGATLDQLERRLAPLGREPHSVIGSSCIGASVIGGICNNSGGALVRRGPAYTEYALFARVGGDGSLELCNHLGLALGLDPEEILDRLDRGDIDDTLICEDTRRASAADTYDPIVRDLDAGSPARFNNDPAGLFEASGCAGKLAVFAVRVDTFPRETGNSHFYIGTNDPSALAALRQDFLREGPVLPISGEYIHREAFDLADQYGKDMVVAIDRLGTSRLPGLFAWKNRIDRLAGRVLGRETGLSDRVLQAAAKLLGDHLPARLRDFRDRFEHHLILNVPEPLVGFTRTRLNALFCSSEGGYFECTPQEAARATLHRFAVAGAAVRYRAIHPEEIEDIISLDIALPRNTAQWFESLPSSLTARLVGKLYYGHFFCHVFHQDYLVRKGADVAAIERELLALADVRHAEYPAEHNVGHHYAAKPCLAAHYARLDPTNAFNPGVGKTARTALAADG